jgi:hypothetical protein
MKSRVKAHIHYPFFGVITTCDKRKYRVQSDGSHRVLNKPRSRVKRLREERNAR